MKQLTEGDFDWNISVMVTNIAERNCGYLWELKQLQTMRFRLLNSLSYFLPQFELQHQVQLGDQEAKLT